MKIKSRFSGACAAWAFAGLLTACGGGAGGDTSNKVSLSGSVSAPNGALAFSAPETLLTRLASLFVPRAYAQQSSGTFSGVGAGVTVSLIEIDASLNQVGAALATTTTAADGSYTLLAPEGFVPAAKYVIRATGTQGTMDAIVTGTTVNVDPVTNVVTTLIVTSPDTTLTQVSSSEVLALTSEVQTLTYDTSLTYSDATTASTSLQLLASSSQEIQNITTSLSTSGVIAGTVKDATGAPMPNAKIVVRDFRNWVTRSVAKTDANGAYLVNVPTSCTDGTTAITCDYIIGAFNGSTASFGASEWWTAEGGSSNQFSAGKTPVPAGETVVRDFVLDDGVRITGSVTGGGSVLGGIWLLLKDFDNDQPLTVALTKPDGSYVFNAPAGLNKKFTMTAVNAGGLPFATQYYAGVGMTSTDPSGAVALSGAPGQSITADMNLPEGTLVTGTVKDNDGNLVTGMTVRAHETDGTYINAVRTDLTGTYKHWLPKPAAPNTHAYALYARGQMNPVTVDGLSSVTVDFAKVVEVFKVVVADRLGAPLSQAKVGLYFLDGGVVKSVGMEVSAADGSVIGYSDKSPVFGEIRLDGGQKVGSILVGAQGSLLAPFVRQDLVKASMLSLPVNLQGGVSDLGVASLDDGNVLTGFVKTSGGLPIPNAKVVIKIKSNGVGADTFATAPYFIGTRSQSDGSFSISLPYTTTMRSLAGLIPGATAENANVNYYVCALVPDPADSTKSLCNKAPQTADISVSSAPSLNL
ncbi:MAG: carboxypeptidase-like regulatory domain-containing protein [Limnohabitans sp.]